MGQWSDPDTSFLVDDKEWLLFYHRIKLPYSDRSDKGQEFEFTGNSSIKLASADRPELLVWILTFKARQF